VALPRWKIEFAQTPSIPASGAQVERVRIFETDVNHMVSEEPPDSCAIFRLPVAVALLAALLPARRASRIHPMIACVTSDVL
jgi:hypothetical protein